jgi:hypothetical protein
MNNTKTLQNPRRKPKTDMQELTKNIQKAMQHIQSTMASKEQRAPIPFEAFLEKVYQRPTHMIRNVFQFFHDMVSTHVGEGVDEYPDDPNPSTTSTTISADSLWRAPTTRFLPTACFPTA